MQKHFILWKLKLTVLNLFPFPSFSPFPTVAVSSVYLSGCYVKLFIHTHRSDIQSQCELPSTTQNFMTFTSIFHKYLFDFWHMMSMKYHFRWRTSAPMNCLEYSQVVIYFLYSNIRSKRSDRNTWNDLSSFYHCFTWNMADNLPATLAVVSGGVWSRR